MPDCTVSFQPHDRVARVSPGTTLLEAALAAHITINNLCGGDGICGRCRMIVKSGEVRAPVSGKLTREEIRRGYVLACQAVVEQDLLVEIPDETRAKEKIIADEDAERFRDFSQVSFHPEEYIPSPLVTKVYLEMEPPTLAGNMADHQRVDDAVRRKLRYRSMQMGLKMIRTLPEVLRENGYRITATVGLRRDIAEVMNIEGGDTSARSYMVVVDMGTTTIVAHLVDANTIRTIDAKACFNSQGMYGREVTARIMAAERRGVEELQQLLISDINQLIAGLAAENRVSRKDITAVVCAGNTVMGHFLLGLDPRNIRRSPYVPATVAAPPLRAAEVGIEINPRGLLYSLPGISGWVGSDITAGILATEIIDREELCLLVDVGTNGEIVVGNRDWLVASAASAGPALEGASEECGMRAERGAIEQVFAENGKIGYRTVGGQPPAGICGSGIIDLISVLLDQGVINRSGSFLPGSSDRLTRVNGVSAFILADRGETGSRKRIFITESDIENVVTAKAAIFAAIRILLSRLELSFSDIGRFFLAGAFGNTLNIESAVTIGLIPDIPRERVQFVGNTSIRGAKIAAFYREAFYKIERIRENTTYYDLMGADDYVDEFRKAMFLPHTDIEIFQSVAKTRAEPQSGSALKKSSSKTSSRHLGSELRSDGRSRV